MKFLGGIPLEEIRRRKSQWHNWFAWYPVRVGVDSKTKRYKYAWLEVVGRRNIRGIRTSVNVHRNITP